MCGANWKGKHCSPCELTFPSRAQTEFHGLSSSGGQKGPRRVLTVHTQATCFQLYTEGVD